MFPPNLRPGLPNPLDLFRTPDATAQAGGPGLSQVLSDLTAVVGNLQRGLGMASLPQLSDSPGQLLVTTYPLAGGKRAMPSGQSQIDVVSGRVIRRDAPTGDRMSTSLETWGLTRALSGVLWADTTLNVTAVLAKQNLGTFELPQGVYLPLYFAFDRLILDALRPYDVMLMASSLPVPPVIFERVVTAQERYHNPTTGDAFAGVLWRPQGGRILDATFGDEVLDTQGMGSKLFIVTNTGTASADLNLQFQEADGASWVDDPNTTGPSYTLASADTAIVESGLAVRAARLRVRSSSGGTPTTLRCSYRAVPLLR